MGLSGLLGWTLMVAGMLALIFVSLKSKNGQALPKSRGSAIGAGIFGLGGLISLVGAALAGDTGGAIRYAILLVLLAILVLAVLRRRGDA
jgi:hypothetical protein